MAVDVVVPVASDARGVRHTVWRMAQLRLGPEDTLTVVDNRGVGVRDPAVLVAAAVRTSYFARNAGAARGRAPWILFLDADVEPPPDLLERLLDPEPRPEVGVLAGGIADGPGRAPAERYARLRRSMDHETVLRGRGAFAFAQTAHCAVRREAFEAAGGFEPGVRSGGDADLCFRLRALGWELEARPQATVVHRNRATVRGMLAQRFRHGTGAAWLERRWPGAVPARPLPGVAWWGLRRTAAGIAAAVRGDGDEALLGLLDGPAVLAFELGRAVPNRPLAHGGHPRTGEGPAHQGQP
jgi:hypothetical protein